MSDDNLDTDKLVVIYRYGPSPSDHQTWVIPNDDDMLRATLEQIVDDLSVDIDELWAHIETSDGYVEGDCSVHVSNPTKPPILNETTA